MAVRIHSDLTFSFEEPATDGLAGRRLTGTMHADGDRLELTLDTLPEVSVRSAAPVLRAVAAWLERRGLTLAVHGPQGLVLTIGQVRARLIERVLVRSGQVRLHDVRSVLRVARRRKPATSRLQLSDLVPPITMLPLAPTFRPQPRRVTTTHDPLGGGSPRLFFAAASLPGQATRVFYLKPGTTIGSGDCDLQLTGLDELQAEVRRNDEDEYLLVPRSGTVPTMVNGRAATTETLMRTGTRLQLGEWTMSYFRAEDADHGRPYGGRIGGELGYQRPQRRPRYVSPGPHA